MRNHRTIAIVFAAAAAAAGAGCKSNTLRNWEPPENLTPEYEAKQLSLSNEKVREAQRLELAKKGDEAIAKYNDAIKDYPANAVAWHNVGRLYAKKGLNVEAANSFKTASELAPSDPRSLYCLGALWEELGYLDDAAKWYDQALDRDPSHLNTLRRSILVDDLRNSLNQTTADRVKRALQMEREAWWINRFKRIKQRMEEPNFGQNRPDRAPTPPPSSPASTPPSPEDAPMTPLPTS